MQSSDRMCELKQNGMNIYVYTSLQLGRNEAICMHEWRSGDKWKKDFTFM